MFFAQDLLSKKTPMGQVWLAATINKPLKRAQIFELDVKRVVGEIMQPKEALALRFSGQLLLGVVRVYERQVYFLFMDCNDALLKIKTATRPTTVDMAKPAAAAAVNVATFGAFADNVAEEDFDMNFDVLFDAPDTSNMAEVTLGLSSQTQSPASQRGHLSRSHGTPMNIELPRFASPEAEERGPLLQQRASVASRRVSEAMFTMPDEFAPAMDDDEALRELQEQAEPAPATGAAAPLGGDLEVEFDGLGHGLDLDLDLHPTGFEATAPGSARSKSRWADVDGDAEAQQEEVAAEERGEQVQDAAAAAPSDSQDALAELAELQRADEEAKEEEHAGRAPAQQRRTAKRVRKVAGRDEATVLDMTVMRSLIENPDQLLSPNKRLRAAVRVAVVPLAAAFENSVFFSALAPQLAAFARQALSCQPMPYPRLPADLRALVAAHHSESEPADDVHALPTDDAAGPVPDDVAALDQQEAEPSSKRRRSSPLKPNVPAGMDDFDFGGLGGGFDDVELPRDRDDFATEEAPLATSARDRSRISGARPSIPDLSAIAEQFDEEHLPDVQLSFAPGDDAQDLPLSSTQDLTVPGKDLRLHRNTVRTIRTLDKALASRESVTFSQITHGVNRQNAARAFLQILVLKTSACIQVQQESPFAPIHLSRAGRFEEHAKAATA